MDFNKLIARVKAILTTPKTEWPVIAAEPATVADLYKNYIVWLAAIPVVCKFIKGSFIGYGAFGIYYRTPIGAGITGMIIGYALTLALVYVVALIVDALAPTFGGPEEPGAGDQGRRLFVDRELGRRHRRTDSGGSAG